MASTAKSAQQLLDEVNRRAQLEALPGAGYATRLAEELAAPAADLAALDARDAGLRAALAAIDVFAKKAMRIHLDHALADDRVLQRPFRTYLANEVLAYHGRLELLRERVLGSVGRVAEPAAAAAAAREIVEAARAVHELRAALWEQVLALVRSLAEEALPVAAAAARSPQVSDDERRRWSAMRRDLEQQIAEPTHVAAAPLAARLAALPVVDEPVDRPPEPTLGELIEMY